MPPKVRNLIPESFYKCPSCLDIPEAEVYQCKNGHVLCNLCYSRIQVCPICKVPFGEDKIRNLKFETILDILTLPCNYKDAGCNAFVKAKEMRTHAKQCVCKMRVWKICDYLGYKCDFQANILKLPEILGHFQQQHQFICQNIPSANTKLLNFEKITKDSINVLWTPVILTKVGAGSTALRFLIVFQLNKSDQSLWMCCQMMEDPLKEVIASHGVKFCIKSYSDKVANMEWIVSPKVFSNFYGKTAWIFTWPIMKVPIGILNSYYVYDGSLTIAVNVTHESQEKIETLKVLEMQPQHLFPTEKSTELLTQSQGLALIVSCSDCKRKISEDIWYTCLQCRHWTLCCKCMTQRIHCHHIFAMLKGPLQVKYFEICAVDNKNQAVAMLPEINDEVLQLQESIEPMESFLVECSICGCYPIIGVLYRCFLCPQRVNICQTCVERGTHSNHILGVILDGRQEEFIDIQMTHRSTILPLLASIVNLS